MTNKQPIAEIRLGRIAAAIWKNDTGKGAYYNVSFSRLYKDGPDWRRSDSFGRDDLLLVAKLADMAHSHIFELRSEAKDDEHTEQEAA